MLALWAERQAPSTAVIKARALERAEQHVRDGTAAGLSRHTPRVAGALRANPQDDVAPGPRGSSQILPGRRGPGVATRQLLAIRRSACRSNAVAVRQTV